MKDALKEFKAMFKEEIWPGIVGAGTWVMDNWRAIRKGCLTIVRWTFWLGLLWFGVKVASNDIAGSFSLLKVDRSTGEVSIGEVDLKQKANAPMEAKADNNHRIGASYMVNGDVTLEYDKNLWNLKLFKIDLGVRATQTAEGKVTPGFSISLRF